MSVISDFAQRQNAYNDRHDAALEGVTADVQALKDLVAQLQATQGQITPEDQALLDQIEQRTAAATTKLEALNEMTPPTVPAEPAPEARPGR